MSQMLVNINGRFVPFEHAQRPLNDTGLLFGDTLFETFRADKHRIQLQKEHLDRLCLSARLLDFPCNRPRIETALAQMASALQHDFSRLRLTLSRGTTQGFKLAQGDDSWFALTAVEAKPPTADEREQGAVCISAPNSRSNPLDHLPQMKRGNHADCLYAADFALKHNAREALFIEQDLVIEGSSSNIFACFEDQLFTPPSGKLVLAGVTRQQIIAAATEFGLLVTEEALPLERLMNADEIWLTNAMIELLPVSRINGQAIKRGTLWHKIHSLYKQRTET